MLNDAPQRLRLLDSSDIYITRLSISQHTVTMIDCNRLRRKRTPNYRLKRLLVQNTNVKRYPPVKWSGRPNRDMIERLITGIAKI